MQEKPVRSYSANQKAPGFPPHNPSVDIQAELEAFRESALHRLKARLEGKHQRNYTVDERRD
jgi:hypothetical protein